MAKLVNLFVLDFETGGLISEENPITEVGLQVLHPVEFKELASYRTYVRPYNNLKIVKQALDATGIKMSDINNGISIEKAVENIVKMCKVANPRGRKMSKPILIGHNIAFDIAFLEYAFEFCNLKASDYFADNNGILVYVDTMRLAMIKWNVFEKGDDTAHTLTACCNRAGINIVNAHSALDDVRATAQLFQFFQNGLKTEGNVDDTEVSSEKSRKFFKF